jgi:hypothetical protein
MKKSNLIALVLVLCLSIALFSGCNGTKSDIVSTRVITETEIVTGSDGKPNTTSQTGTQVGTQPGTQTGTQPGAQTTSKTSPGNKTTTKATTTTKYTGITTVYNGERTPVTGPNLVNDSVIGTGLGQFTYNGIHAHQNNGREEMYMGDISYQWYKNVNATISISFRFKGTQCTIYGGKMPYGGLCTVEIDGKVIGDVDFYEAAELQKQPIFTSEVLKSGEHTIKVINSGRQNDFSEGNCYAIDYIAYK